MQLSIARRNAMHVLQLVSLALLQHAAALQLTTSQHRRIAPLAASPVCELQDDGPELDTNAAATLQRAGLNTPAANALVSLLTKLFPTRPGESHAPTRAHRG